MTTNLHIREVQLADAEAICSIYNHYIATSIVTFDEEAQTVDQWLQKIRLIQETHPFLVATDDKNALVAYAYANIWKTRKAYRYTIESSIYLHPEAMGKGIGKQLYSALFDDLRNRGFKRVLAGISLPNPQSVGFHESCGFQHQGTLLEVGKKFGRWIDVGYWGLNLD